MPLTFNKEFKKDKKSHEERIWQKRRIGFLCLGKKAWIEIEKEHTNSNSNKQAEKIVKDHLREFGCDYYPELIKMEKNLSKK